MHVHIQRTTSLQPSSSYAVTFKPVTSVVILYYGEKCQGFKTPLEIEGPANRSEF